jgi:hypothetical protein
MSTKLTSNEFIEKAKTVHGDKYDYSKVEYVNAHTKVCIICPEHGEFWQTPSSHLNGRGCPKCANIKRGETFIINNEEFIKRVVKKHGNEYNYDKIDYINARTPVIVECKKHGEFEIPAYRLISGGGCPQCANEKRSLSNHNKKTTEIFINELKEKFGNRINYSEVVYINANTPVIITDNELGIRYKIAPTKLLSRGLLKKTKLTKKEFIEKARKIHGDKYDYSKVEYVNTKTKVCIICPEHGEFWQTPASHLRGYGCPKCGHNKCSSNLAKNKNDFINEANVIHGNFFNYEHFNYINYHTKSFITCPIHGDFLQTPAKHLMGHGCPKCNESHLEREVRLFLESKNIHYTSQFKPIWLKNGNGIQRVDFLINNTNYLIECQGIQHFVKPNFKYNLNINKIIELDKRKYKLANENGYVILYYTTRDNIKYKNNNSIYTNNIFTDLDELFNVIMNN